MSPGPMAPNSCPVEALDVSSHILFFSLTRKATQTWPQGEEKGGNKVPFQNTCFGAVINETHARSPAKIKQL